MVDDRPVLKAGTSIPASATIVITAEDPKYVCRAGLKLEAALRHFGVDPTGLTALDSGLSTGGFTDCLLQHGAAHVVGVDVGYGQVAERVRTHPQVTVMERTNLRHLRRADLPGGELVDIVTLDLSFISGDQPGYGHSRCTGGLALRFVIILQRPVLRADVCAWRFRAVLKVIDAICDVLKPDGQLIVLIKPQFEAGKQQVGAGGVVRDPAVHAEVIERVVAGLRDLGFQCSGWMESPIKGATSGNTEFLAHFKRQLARSPIDQEQLEAKGDLEGEIGRQ